MGSSCSDSLGTRATNTGALFYDDHNDHNDDNDYDGADTDDYELILKDATDTDGDDDNDEKPDNGFHLL